MRQITFYLALVCLVASLAGIQTSRSESPPPPQLNAAAQRILAQVADLKKSLPQLAELKSPVTDDDGPVTLYFERGVTWKLEDPTKPASKLNARLAEFEPQGFWIRLYFYQGPWRGAALFQATDLGDNQNLWFSYGYRPGDDPKVIAAITKIIEAERPKPNK